MSEHRDDWVIATLLDDVSALAVARDKVSLGELVDTLGARGFGPLLVVLSAFLILPVGMVPGMPGIVGLFLILIGSRMAVGSTQLWLPERLRRVTLPARLLVSSVARAQPAVLWLRPLVAPRLPYLVESDVMLRVIAIILMATGAVNILIGFIPGLPFLMSMHVLVLGIAVSSRDGVLGLVGYALLLPELVIIWRLLT
ncbi:hypothetical protein Ga0609869_002821 [Rhodovulum iodosum]|uniref:Exopolysaccharide biosynthesis protein n=1 Tax=Rhodovulum iodosum TaxID=68291 RepID=A0ABV3XVS9_9RHOB|nr:exopolysaccharide biosynthesis protein [Rhodovulum robiginosum]RSK36395.1 exopolysaccharide biosynthesis protein [Rhodovulum robiginosum]